jgi:hypothetical protein
MRLDLKDVAARVEPILARYGLKPVPTPAGEASGDGYSAAFQGPSIRGKFPCIAIFIPELELQAAHDMEQLDQLIRLHTDRAIVSYQEMLAEGPQ